MIIPVRRNFHSAQTDAASLPNHLSTPRNIYSIPFCCLLIVRRYRSAQSAREIPEVWTNAMRGLADKIAATVGTTRNISLDVRNISSMSQSEAGAAQRALESELAQRQFRIVPSISAASLPPSDASAQVRVTFSEGVEGLVWVAEIRSSNAPSDSPQVAIVSTSKVTTRYCTRTKSLVDPEPEAYLGTARQVSRFRNNSAINDRERGVTDS